MTLNAHPLEQYSSAGPLGSADPHQSAEVQMSNPAEPWFAVPEMTASGWHTGRMMAVAPEMLQVLHLIHRGDYAAACVEANNVLRLLGEIAPVEM